MASPFERPNQRDAQRGRTRQRLFEAARAEFERVGFDRASVARIAREAGVSRPSFYFHFPTKEHVLLEMQWMDEIRIVSRLSESRSLCDVLERLIDGILESKRDFGSGDLFRDRLRVYVQRPPELDLDDQPFPLVHELERRFARGAAELRPGLDPVAAASLLLRGVFGLLLAPPAGDSEDLRRDLLMLVSLFLAQEPHSA